MQKLYLKAKWKKFRCTPLSIFCCIFGTFRSLLVSKCNQNPLKKTFCMFFFDKNVLLKIVKWRFVKGITQVKNLIHVCIVTKDLLKVVNWRAMKLHTQDKKTLFISILWQKNRWKGYYSQTWKNSYGRTLTSEKPYVCSICDKKFAQKQHMKIHEKIHKDEIPYSCLNCDKTFTQNAHMKLNERTHNGVVPTKWFLGFLSLTFLIINLQTV